MTSTAGGAASAGRPNGHPTRPAPGTGDAASAAPGLPPAASPWSDSRFWLLQLVVLALALVRLAVTVAFHLDTAGVVLEVSTVLLFVVPVVVASLAYGLPGGLATTGWVAVLCVPRLVQAASDHRRGELWAEVLQLVVLGVLALLIGGRVSAETQFRDQADAARTARMQAELLYQDMFESNRSPILIVDADGFVVGSNASADVVFGPPRDPDTTRTGSPVAGAGAARRRLVDVVGAEAAALVLTRLLSDDETPRWADGGSATGDVDHASRTAVEDVDDLDGAADDRVRPVAFDVAGRQVLYRPTAALVGAPGADRRMQVIFEDVTAETRRHDLMEAYAGQVVLGQEEERRHLAQELHDGPLQTLIHLCRQIDAVEAGGEPGATGTVGRPDGADDRPGAPTLSSLRTTVEETVAELRSIARGLRPSVLDDLGLVASLNQVVQDATGRQGFESSFEVGGDVRRLPPAVELAVFRVGQEAVTNVERHADAARLAVRLAFADDGVRLTVEDDGAGFDRQLHARADDGSSLGLPGMVERSRLAGGRLNVRSGPGAGTTVEMWVPSETSQGS